MVTKRTGRSADDPRTWEDVAAVWAMAHGIADLMGSGRLKYIAGLPDAAREEAVKRVLSRCLRDDD